MNKSVLIVEDEARILEITSDYFKANDFHVFEAIDGQEALDVFNSNKIDLVVLDIMMPKLDGWSVCRRIRKNSDVPIIIITARSDEDDKLMGFELGADEYVTKPFSPKVLVARAKNLLKRASGSINSSINILKAGDIKIDKSSYMVTIGDEQLDLAPKEFSLLVYLIENKGLVLSRETILNNVWGYDFFGDLRVVDTHIKKLRKKLGDKSSYIHTLIRVGYKFEVL
ncbi:response regulator transcription factor [Anaeromicrobium sediminis]|uniref:Stage 0 sporulation protein A homolog n=1 Tax=Anaeromicrobium sediminis TaxID=1478221 RepID=A0A267MBT7_9FIRM|nr:response regulator transcription factor [Anaeromicrobium sediminis]PAB57019.1 DNA-binding response regulator [Anaeromicrobium sediminis]